MKRNPPTWYLSFGQLKVGEKFSWYNPYDREQGVTGPVMRKVSKRMYVIESYPADYTGMRGSLNRRYTTGSRTGVTTVKSNPCKRNPGGKMTWDVSPGDRVYVKDRFGVTKSGRAVMTFPSHAVLNMGGKHGTPQVADDGNIVKVVKKGGGKHIFRFRSNPCLPCALAAVMNPGKKRKGKWVKSIKKASKRRRKANPRKRPLRFSEMRQLRQAMARYQGGNNPRKRRRRKS
jgi:hypothetical protein